MTAAKLTTTWPFGVHFVEIVYNENAKHHEHTGSSGVPDAVRASPMKGRPADVSTRLQRLAAAGSRRFGRPDVTLPR